MQEIQSHDETMSTILSSIIRILLTAALDIWTFSLKTTFLVDVQSASWNGFKINFSFGGICAV